MPEEKLKCNWESTFFYHFDKWRNVCGNNSKYSMKRSEHLNKAGCLESCQILFIFLVWIFYWTEVKRKKKLTLFHPFLCQFLFIAPRNHSTTSFNGHDTAIAEDISRRLLQQSLNCISKYSSSYLPNLVVQPTWVPEIYSKSLIQKK